ncbi:hypothetical protein HG536_0F02330 [Torulaspora globosa]|uniref:Histidinol-phosphatase n=1 Tax=Torulaspora globosa TaxID=48254 RepID=A0A7G3ZK72_9SACH|nr:uncharacterized protein HG536_0F02330 [Torulaspora globosa]QLL33908.1 hypothetical protein HG536_0F02330 [Torulaspora globosa]
MHSHHSHSGDYIAHGVDPLEAVTAQAVKMKFHTYCLTEHMPRFEAKYLYPEEWNSKRDESAAIAKLQQDFQNFLDHAQRIKNRPNPSNTKFLIGVEVESCDLNHIEYARRLVEENRGVIQFSVGSVHHINEIAIDFNQIEWDRALAASGNNLKTFLLAYFDLQYKMLRNLQPLVVGHFDLYKLFLPQDLRVDLETGACGTSGTPVSGISLINQWKEVQAAVVRNLQYIEKYGGAIEINTSALRKKLPEPYPGKDVGLLVKRHCGGRFVLSDDAHGVAQVGVCYDQALNYIVHELNLEKIYYLTEAADRQSVRLEAVPIDQFESDAFWRLYRAPK